MTTPLGSATPSPGTSQTSASPAVMTQRVHLWEKAAIARLSINPPLDAATLAELAHLLETWNPPTAMKALALDLTTSTLNTNVTLAENAGGKGPIEGRQGRVRERALIVAQERAVAALNRLRMPILGIAAGVIPPLGCLLLAACDLLLAADNTCFVREGAASLSYRAVPPRLGATGALPERLGAHQAYRQGIVNWLATPDQLAGEVDQILALLQDKSAVALVLAKRAFLLGLAHPKETDKALEKIGELYLRELMTTPDALEGLHAFLEKRSPSWQEKEPAPRP